MDHKSKDVVVAIMSGTFDRIVAKCIDVQRRDADAGWDTFIEHSVRWITDSTVHYGSGRTKSLSKQEWIQLANLSPTPSFEDRGRCASDLSCGARETSWWVMGRQGREGLRREYGDRV